MYPLNKKYKARIIHNVTLEVMHCMFDSFEYVNVLMERFKSHEWTIHVYSNSHSCELIALYMGKSAHNEPTD